MNRLSLRARMAIVFGVLIAGVAVFMIAFFPARMAEQAQASAELRALTVTQVMASAVAPALEFDDAENAARVLRWLDNAPDARFAVLVGDGGTRFATWSPERIPAVLPAAQSAVDGDLLVTSAPVVGRAGVRGTLYVGQSLERLVALRDAATTSAVTASVIVLLICLLACIAIATALVRPLERLTTIARDIARGAKPPKIAGATGGGPEVVAMTTALGSMLDRLNEANRQLVEASRHAGMAEVATGVLHNVGNILTSVNVGIETLHERAGTIPADRVRRAGELLGTARTAADPAAKLDAGVKYLAAIADHLDGDRTALLAELVKLRDHLAHISRVVTMQNGYARIGAIHELVDLATLVAEATALGCPDPERHAIEVVRHVASAELVLDRHRVLQIMVNLLANARDSVTAHAGAEVRITVRATVEDSWLELSVEDTGGGIAPESLSRIFNAGFTTKPKGHGYGLHSSALAAEQLGGELRCESAGLGHGARFVLRIPTEKGKSNE